MELEQPSPPGVGRDESQQAELPNRLESRFRGRRFVPVDSPELLDHEGAELILIGADEDVTRSWVSRSSRGTKTIETAEIFNDPRMARTPRPLRPLFTGQWE